MVFSKKGREKCLLESIAVNGRVPGTRTSVGIAAVAAGGNSQSVVDYFIVTTVFHSQVCELEVSAELEVWDSCTPVLPADSGGAASRALTYLSSAVS